MNALGLIFESSLGWERKPRHDLNLPSDITSAKVEKTHGMVQTGLCQ